MTPERLRTRARRRLRPRRAARSSPCPESGSGGAARCRRAAGRGGRPRRRDRARRRREDRASASARPSRRPCSARARSSRSPRGRGWPRPSWSIVDAPLTPIQQRISRRRSKAKVIDRTGLILEIFGERAATAEGRLQVELAHLDYQAGRLVRSWTHLERQRGGFGFLGGPGETQIEADRRLIRDRMAKLRKRAGPGHAARAALHRDAARSARRGRSSRWSAIPMRASRRCSTG